MSKSDLNGERSQCRYTGLSYCSVTHHEAGIPACRTEMVKMVVFSNHLQLQLEWMVCCCFRCKQCILYLQWNGWFGVVIHVNNASYAFSGIDDL